MGILVQLPSPEDRRERTSRSSDSPQTRMHSIIKNTLPIDVEKVRQSTNGSAVFLAKLLHEKEINIALPEEEIDENTIMRVLGENNESWDMSVGEFIEIMTEKPSSTQHEDIQRYLASILSRVGVEIILDFYSPDVENSITVTIDAQNLRELLNDAVVSVTAEGISHFRICMDLDTRGAAVYPNVFEKPKEASLFSLAVEYLVQTWEDKEMIYSSDDTVEILFYRNGTMHIINVPYGDLSKEIMSRIYTDNPGYRSMNNDSIALGVFYNKFVRSLLRT